MDRIAHASFAALAAVVLSSAPESCLKKKKPVEPDAPQQPIPAIVPVTSATTPPIWHPPEATASPGTATTAAAPPASPELVKARAAAEAKDFKKVRTLLEKRVRGSAKVAPEEAQLVHRACVVLKDRACADAVKAKHPDDISE